MTMANDEVMQPEEADPGVTQFRDAFQDSEFHLLEPVREQVNYSFELMPADPYTLELRADKWWLGENDRVENSTLTLNTYDYDARDDEAHRAAVREEALLDKESLLRTHAQQGLGAAMRAAEQMAVNNGYLDADRQDPRLFTEGPEDPFLTGREVLSLAEKLADLNPEPGLPGSAQITPDYNVALSGDDTDKTILELVKSWGGGPANGGGEAHRLIGTYSDGVEAGLLAQELLGLKREVAAMTGDTVAGNQAMVSLACEIALAGGLMQAGDLPFGMDGPPDPFRVQPTDELFAQYLAQQPAAAPDLTDPVTSLQTFDLDL